MPVQFFLGQIFIEEKNITVDIANNDHIDLTLRYDGSKLDKGGAGAAVVWKENRQSNK